MHSLLAVTACPPPRESMAGQQAGPRVVSTGLPLRCLGAHLGGLLALAGGHELEDEVGDACANEDTAADGEEGGVAHVTGASEAKVEEGKRLATVHSHQLGVVVHHVQALDRPPRDAAAKECIVCGCLKRVRVGQLRVGRGNHKKRRNLVWWSQAAAEALGWFATTKNRHHTKKKRKKASKLTQASNEQSQWRKVNVLHPPQDHPHAVQQHKDAVEQGGREEGTGGEG